MSTIHPISCLFALIRFLAFVAAALPSAAFCQDSGCTPQAVSSTAIEYPAVKISVGQKLDFVAYARQGAFGQAVREDFWITIREIWNGGVSFGYELVGEATGNMTVQGIQNLSSLDECTSLDPWWEVGENDFDNRCEIWISRRMFMELITTGKTWLAVDTLARNDSIVRWELVDRNQFLTHIKGRPVLLSVLRVKTSRDDEFAILDDPDNPLILSAKSTYFSWSLDKIE